MKISSRSWHFRLVRKWEGKSYDPETLCSYFWAVAGYSILTFVGGLALIAMSPFLLLFVGIAYAGFWIWEHRPQRKNKVRKESGLLRQWLKARKDKVCPLIEVVD